MQKKHNWYGYVDYFYPRAKWLEENCLLGDLSYTSDEAWENVDDELMLHSPNYNCVSRTYEGFNNVNEDLVHRDKSPMFHKRSKEVQDRILNYKTKTWSDKMFFWNFLVHRATGSGFSGEADHGYRNNIVSHFGELDSASDMMELGRSWVKNKQPFFTSKGNIPPHPKPGLSIFETMGKYHYKILGRLSTTMMLNDKPMSIKDTTDWLNNRNIDQGIKRWNFAFSMLSADIATYFPNKVDPMSDLYFGKNAYEAVLQMYEKPKGWNTQRLCDYAGQELTEVLGTNPMAHEDTLCIYTRFLKGISRTGDYKSNSGYEFQEKN